MDRCWCLSKRPGSFLEMLSINLGKLELPTTFNWVFLVFNAMAVTNLYREGLGCVPRAKIRDSNSQPWKFDDLHMLMFVHFNRVKDWLYMISQARPEGDKDTAVDGDTEAENLRSMFHLVTWSKQLGGAGITPEHGKWKNVKSAFPMHNQVAVKALLAQWTRQLYLKAEDLDDIRSIFGEKVMFFSKLDADS